MSCFTLLGCLELVKKFVVGGGGGGGWVCKPILVFSLGFGQAEQQYLTITSLATTSSWDATCSVDKELANNDRMLKALLKQLDKL